MTTSMAVLKTSAPSDALMTCRTFSRNSNSRSAALLCRLLQVEKFSLAFHVFAEMCEDGADCQNELKFARLKKTPKQPIRKI